MNNRIYLYKVAGLMKVADQNQSVINGKDQNRGTNFLVNLFQNNEKKENKPPKKVNPKEVVKKFQGIWRNAAGTVLSQQDPQKMTDKELQQTNRWYNNFIGGQRKLPMYGRDINSEAESAVTEHAKKLGLKMTPEAAQTMVSQTTANPFLARDLRARGAIVNNQSDVTIAPNPFTEEINQRKTKTNVVGMLNQEYHKAQEGGNQNKVNNLRFLTNLAESGRVTRTQGEDGKTTYTITGKNGLSFSYDPSNQNYRVLKNETTGYLASPIRRSNLNATEELGDESGFWNKALKTVWHGPKHFWSNVFSGKSPELHYQVKDFNPKEFLYSPEGFYNIYREVIKDIENAQNIRQQELNKDDILRLVRGRQGDIARSIEIIEKINSGDTEGIYPEEAARALAVVKDFRDQSLSSQDLGGYAAKQVNTVYNYFH